MAMFDSTNIPDSHGRTRRHRHFSGKSYDGEGERSLELRGILEVLSVYRDYEGGINCCVCGKLYKSKVCFIKHLWEHSVYWNLFPGDKNHERVLAIQAALILYSKHYGVSYKDAERMTELLVTAPSCHETSYPCTPKKDKDAEPSHTCPVMPSTPQKHDNLHGHSMATYQSYSHMTYPVTPQKDNDMKMVCPPAPKKAKAGRDLNRKRTHSLKTGKGQKKRRLDFGREGCEFSAPETLLELRTAIL